MQINKEALKKLLTKEIFLEVEGFIKAIKGKVIATNKKKKGGQKSAYIFE